MKRLSGLLALVVFLAGLSPARAQDARALDFWAACRNGDVAKVREFLDKGMDVNTKFEGGLTPLSSAAMRNQLEVAKLLVERGASLTLRDDFHITALGVAIMFGSNEVVQFLLPRSTEDMDVVLLFGVFRGQPALVEVGLKSRPAPLDLTRAWVAAKAGKKDDIRALLEKAGAQPPPALQPEELASFIGRFKDATEMELEVALRDGKLIGTGGSGFSSFFEEELLPLSQTLVALSSDPTTTYRFEGDSKPFDRVTMTVLGGQTHALKRTGGQGK